MRRQAGPENRTWRLWGRFGAVVVFVAVIAVGCASSGESGGEARAPEDGGSVDRLAESCTKLSAREGEKRAEPWESCDRLARRYIARPAIDPRHARRVYAWTCRRDHPLGCLRAGEWGRTLSGRKRFREMFDRGCRLGSGLACKRRMRWPLRESQKIRAMRIACRDGVSGACRRVEAAGHRSEWVSRVVQVATTRDRHWHPEPEAGPVWGVNPTTLYGGFGSHLWQCRLEGCLDEGMRRRPFGPDPFDRRGAELRVRRVESGAIVQLVQTAGGWYVWRPFGDTEPVRLERPGTERRPFAIGPRGERILGRITRSESSNSLVGWDARTGERTDWAIEVEGRPGDVAAFGASPNGDDEAIRVALGLDESVVQIREWPSLETIQTLEFDGKPLSGAFGLGGRRLAVCAGSEAHLYALEGTESEERPRHLAAVPCRANTTFGPNGEIWAVSQPEGLDLRDPSDGSRLAPTIGEMAGRMAFDPTGRYLAVDGYDRRHNSLVALRPGGAAGERGAEAEGARESGEPPEVRPMPASMFEPPPTPLRGRVTWREESEAPVEGATIVYEPDGPHAPTARTRTDADGRFELERLEPGKGKIRYDAVGARPSRASVEVPSDEPVTVTLRRTAVVRGRVRHDDGSPASGARVLLEETTEELDRTKGYVADTDKAGRYVFGSVDSGARDYRISGRTYRLKAWHRSGGFARTELEVSEKTDFERDLRLGDPDDPSILRVQVRTEAGEPIEGAFAKALASRDETDGEDPREVFGDVWWLKGKSGPGGWWMSDRLPEMVIYEVGVRAFGNWRSAEPGEVRMPREQPVRVTLPVGEIRVVVEGERARPNWPRREDALLLRTEALTGDAPESVSRRDVMPEVQEDELPVRFTGLEAGRWTLVTCELRGHRCGIQTMDLAPDETKTLKFRIRGGGRSVTGRLRAAESGVPLAGVTVRTHRVRLPELQYEKFKYEVRTDPRGRFRFDGLLPGHHRLEIRGDGLRPRDVDIEVFPSEDRAGDGPIRMGVIDVWNDRGAP